jgi:hypothetical protein
MMKKIITLVVACLLMSKVFSGPAFHIGYSNITQNTGFSVTGVPACNVTGNYGDSIHLNAVEIPGGSMYIFPEQWFFNGDSIPNSAGANNIKIKFNQPGGTYSAYLGAYFGITVYFYAGNMTGITSINNINSLRVFPTAVNSSITIQLNSIKLNNIEISFFDMNGRQLKTDFYKNIVGEFIKNENTEALAKGIYFLRIKAGEDVVEKKFVKI